MWWDIRQCITSGKEQYWKIWWYFKSNGRTLRTHQTIWRVEKGTLWLTWEYWRVKEEKEC